MCTAFALMRKLSRNSRSMNRYRRYRPAFTTHITYSPRVFPLRSDAYLKLSVEIPRPYLRCCARRDRGIRLARSNPHRSTWATANARVDTRSVAPNINHLALVSECEPPLALHAQLVVAHWSDGQTFGGLCRLLRFALTIVFESLRKTMSVGFVCVCWGF